MSTTPASTSDLWRHLGEMVSQRDYIAAQEALDALHLVLGRVCAVTGCTRLAMKQSRTCGRCWGKSPSGRAAVARTMSRVAHAVRVVARDELNASVVATVAAEEAEEAGEHPALGAGSEGTAR